MKAVWKGTLSFGLVSIQVELFSAVQEHSLGFKLLHSECNTPVQYQRWCPHCKKDVVWQDVVKGIKLKDGSYFIMTPANIKKLRPGKTDSIAIVEFVDNSAIEPIYNDHHYYVEPLKSTQKAYFLFTAALARLNKAAIGQFVMRDKEYVCAIQPYHHGLLLTTLNYEYEVRKISREEEKTVAPRFDIREMKLAEQLITKLSAKKLDMSKFKDTFVQKIQQAVEQSEKGIKIPVQRRARVSTSQEAGSLMESLKASLEEPKKARRRIAPKRVKKA